MFGARTVLESLAYVFTFGRLLFKAEWKVHDLYILALIYFKSRFLIILNKRKNLAASSDGRGRAQVGRKRSSGHPC